MTERSKTRTIDEYIAGYPTATQELLEEIRAIARAAAPEATETMSYAIPTLDLNGKHLVHFAGYARHLGFYPTPEIVAAFRDELAPYETAKGSVQFPLDRALPSDLIRRMVEARVRAVAGGDSGGSAGGDRE